MYVRFWETRGSITSPGEGTARYGGNTSCVELRRRGRHGDRARLRHRGPRKLARHATDPLIGLNSRRALHEQYRRIAAARRRKSGMLMLALDVLHLKAINDGFGYTLGDEVLRTVADALIESTRTTDLVARYGGDEFAALLLDAMPKDVDIILARVRDRLGALAAQRRLPLSIDCTKGIAWSHHPPETIEEFLREADRDMHERKARQGARNRVARVPACLASRSSCSGLPETASPVPSDHLASPQAPVSRAIGVPRGRHDDCLPEGACGCRRRRR